jgi:hypothetical protein
VSVIDKVRLSSSASGDVDVGCDPDDFSERYPGLYEMIATQRRKGKTRKTGSLSISVSCGKACVCLTSKESGHCAFYRAEGIGRALEGLEEQLQSGTADWRKDKFK